MKYINRLDYIQMSDDIFYFHLIMKYFNIFYLVIYNNKKIKNTIISI